MAVVTKIPAKDASFDYSFESPSKTEQSPEPKPIVSSSLLLKTFQTRCFHDKRFFIWLCLSCFKLVKKYLRKLIPQELKDFLLAIYDNFLAIGVSKNKSIQKIIWIFINGLFRDFVSKMRPFNSLFYSYFRVENIIGEILQNMMDAMKLLFENNSLKLSKFFNKWIKVKLRRHEPLIQHYIVDSLLLEELVKFMLSEHSRLREAHYENQMTQKLASVRRTSNARQHKMRLGKTGRAKQAKSGKVDPEYKRNEFWAVVERLMMRKPQLKTLLETLENENQKNASRGSKNLYLFFYFQKAPMLIGKFSQPESEECKKSLHDFLDCLFEENRQKLLDNNRNNYFESFGSQMSIVSLRLSNRLSRDAFGSLRPQKMSNIRRLSTIKECGETRHVRSQVQTGRVEKDPLENSFFIKKKELDGVDLSPEGIAGLGMSRQLSEFLAEEDRLRRIKEVIFNQHLIFNNPKFHRKKFLNVIEIGTRNRSSVHFEEQGHVPGSLSARGQRLRAQQIVRRPHQQK